MLRHVVRRMTTYMQIPGYGELIVDANGWDRAVLDRLRAHPLLQTGLADAMEFSLDELRQLRDVYPEAWLRESNAVGSPAQCAQRILGQFDLGADAVILHGASPSELAPVVEAYRAVRLPGRFDRVPANPAGPLRAR